MGFNKYNLSLDVDWAPDFVIDYVAQLLLAYGVKATWFVTHGSPAIERLRNNPEQFELGIHPNFLKGSSHGESVNEVLQFCKDIVPDAVSVRTHSLCMNGEIMSSLCASEKIGVDSSLFLPGVQTIQPFVFENINGRLVRVPVYWSDDYQLSKVDIDFSLPELDTPGVQVYMFHPVHIFLNSPNFDYYTQQKNFIFSDLTPSSALEKLKYCGRGVGSAFLELLTYVKSNGDGGGFLSDFKDVR